MLNKQRMEKQKSSQCVDLKILNRLTKEKRDINVYHHLNRSSHLISSNRSVNCALRAGEEMDYLHISVTSGPGYLKNDCVMDLPPFMNYRFLSVGRFALIHSGKRTLLKIPPGPPSWELRLTIPSQIPKCMVLTVDHVTIGDNEEYNSSNAK